MKREDRSYCWAAAGYVLLLTAIVVLANLGVASWVFSAVGLIPNGDKIGHLLLMGLLSFFLNGALHCRMVSFARVRLLVGSLITYLLVFAEELSQHWVASRNLDVYDMLFDVIGIYLFGHLALWNARLKHKSKIPVDQTDRESV